MPQITRLKSLDARLKYRTRVRLDLVTKRIFGGGGTYPERIRTHDPRPLSCAENPGILVFQTDRIGESGFLE